MLRMQQQPQQQHSHKSIFFFHHFLSSFIQTIYRKSEPLQHRLCVARIVVLSFLLFFFIFCLFTIFNIFIQPAQTHTSALKWEEIHVGKHFAGWRFNCSRLCQFYDNMWTFLCVPVFVLIIQCMVFFVCLSAF